MVEAFGTMIQGALSEHLYKFAFNTVIEYGARIRSLFLTRPQEKEGVCSKGAPSFDQTAACPGYSFARRPGLDPLAPNQTSRPADPE